MPACEYSSGTMKTEKDFSKKLRDKCSGRNLKFYSFESCGLPMTPDLYFVPRDSNSGWLELKFHKEDSEKIGWRPGQQQWLREHAIAGGKAFLVIWLQETDEVIIVSGERAGRANAKATVREMAKLGITISIEEKGWEGVARYLTPVR